MLIVAIIAVICAYIIKGMCGFANTLIFSTIMSFTTSNINITPIDLIVGYPSNIFIVWKERKSISTKIFLPLAGMVVAGVLPGVLFLSKGNVTLVKTLFGFVVFFIGIEMFLRDIQKEKKKSSKLLLTIIGIMTGLLSGLFGIGALLVAYTSRTTENKNQFRGNTCMVFLIESSVRIILYTVTGIINLAVIKKAVILLPFMLIGLFIGTMLSNKSSEKLIKKAVIIVLILSGISIIINNLL